MFPQQIPKEIPVIPSAAQAGSRVALVNGANRRMVGNHWFGGLGGQ